ncbi:hypothetical protein OC846_001330 [Tilletia horrida]|uniref:SIS domain-containing protein n=1 Tax=Tilletia horrida TaxID=155126 RepID=A0AAN6GT86_9BASI|nr:hypothetical protein OC845_001215 [Tilletia horrida]KAK0556235.1 hypothetical protein OC846_001330 [Tilletia horrida]KAK0569101.1 hypothetical protein OC861_001240 [Tilletia horrida]
MSSSNPSRSDASSSSASSSCSSPSLSPFNSEASGSRTSSFSSTSVSSSPELVNTKPSLSASKAVQQHASSAIVEEEGEEARAGLAQFDILTFASRSLHAQSLALAHASWRLTHHAHTRTAFADALAIVHDALRPAAGSSRPGGKIVWTGVGKSGLIGRKLHATALSLGVPSCFLHPVEALHGDLGCVTPQQDVVIALSYSGGSPELVALLPHLAIRGVKTIAMCGRRKEDCDLGRASAAWIDCRTAISEAEELELECEDLDSTLSEEDSIPALDLHKTWTVPPKSPRPILPDHHEASLTRLPAPTSSTTVALAMGDSLLLTLAQMCDFDADGFAFNHPGGKIGEAHRALEVKVTAST